MNKIKIFFLYFLSILAPLSSSSQEDIRSAIFNEFNQKQKKEGFNILRMFVMAPDKFKGYFLQYYGFRKFSLEQAREHFIKNHYSLLNNLNSELRIKDSFYHYPLVPSDISLLYIYFESEETPSSYPFVEMVEIDGPNVKYTFFFKETEKAAEFFIETYNEAFEKVYGRPRQ